MAGAITLFLSLGLISIIQAALLGYGDQCRNGSGTPESENPFDYSDSSDQDQDLDYPGSDDQAHIADSCNFVNGLCIDKMCQCSNPGDMVFNEKLNECGIPTGGHCNRSADGCFTGNECVDSVCKCQSPREPLLISLGDGITTTTITKCTSLRQEECETDKECSARHFLGCFEGICDCKSPMRTVYEEFGLKRGCRIRAGESCNPLSVHVNSSLPAQKCVSNSICTNTMRNESSAWICKCNPGYFATPDGICKKEFSQPCTPTHQECNSYKGLTCKNQECVCVDEDTCFDKEQGACVSSIGQPCGLFSLWYDEYDIGCVKNAECILEDYQIHGHGVHAHGPGVSTMAAAPAQNVSSPVIPRKVCKCKQGFVEKTSTSSEGKQCVRRRHSSTTTTSTTTTTTTESSDYNYNEFDYSSG